MLTNEFEDDSIRQSNRHIIAQDKECKMLISEMKEVEEFLSDFGFLSFGRDFVLCGRNNFSLQVISNACELTLGSIIACCESGCMADANSLLRKYRDDMFFYLYVVVFYSYKKHDPSSQEATNMEKDIERWINNDLRDLQINYVLKSIGKSPWAIDAVKKYDLHSSFDIISDRLNDYVHSNGISFYNRSVYAYQEGDLHKQMQALLNDMRYITVTFLFLLTLCFPQLMMSSDYEDYLDCNVPPPENSQYWVAPFVATFFKNNKDQLGEDSMKCIEDLTNMEFD